MITNIIDGRKQPHRWNLINAVMESTWHDNVCDDVDQANQLATPEVSCEERRGISISEAIYWGTNETAEVTLYFYDRGQGFQKMDDAG